MDTHTVNDGGELVERIPAGGGMTPAGQAAQPAPAKRKWLNAWWCEDGLWNILWRQGDEEWIESYGVYDGQGVRILPTAEDLAA